MLVLGKAAGASFEEGLGASARMGREVDLGGGGKALLLLLLLCGGGLLTEGDVRVALPFP